MSHLTFSRTSNHVIAVGTLDRQRRNGRETTQLHARNAVQGHEQRIVLQVPSPFGQVYGLPLQLGARLEGAELLAQAAPGVALTASGRLEWAQQTDRRYATAPDDTGRTSGELLFHVEALRAAAPEDEAGCDVWLSGVVLSAPRIQRHPHKRSVLLAQTALRVRIERGRQGSRARLVETERVPLVVPLDHPDAPNLLRPGNEVVVEGMLERIVVELRGPEVDRAIAVLDGEWQAQHAALHGSPEQLQTAERRYHSQRRALREATRSRVVAGYVELLNGTPASAREARALREAEVRARHTTHSTDNTGGAGM
jgi:hypothetical protein